MPKVRAWSGQKEDICPSIKKSMSTETSSSSIKYVPHTLNVASFISVDKVELPQVSIFFALNFLPWDFLLIKKLEIEKTKTT